MSEINKERKTCEKIKRQKEFGKVTHRQKKDRYKLSVKDRKKEKSERDTKRDERWQVKRDKRERKKEKAYKYISSSVSCAILAVLLTWESTLQPGFCRLETKLIQISNKIIQKKKKKKKKEKEKKKRNCSKWMGRQ